jgi:hypothetical protein
VTNKSRFERNDHCLSPLSECRNRKEKHHESAQSFSTTTLDEMLQTSDLRDFKSHGIVCSDSRYDLLKLGGTELGRDVINAAHMEQPKSLSSVGGVKSATTAER